ncbi:alpha/beta hydrolase family protein [Rivularia sp. UHCC 0363]|uniref:alpha/beta hydrolase family protein n=1 Tax=Rivularia sp. UHCC 0363 TaxID=3110244 RepID=UPI002B1F0EA8|nr:prolyl oligopeptidase family serine peptidase [Rivularia sp. UHCC 0363]MEA5592838.1 prolyl oligopeptidase family serine peptidase [Rivularia sp. UHCC 0363]
MNNSTELWQTPPQPILQILEAAPPPQARLSPDRRWMVELQQSQLVPIALLAEPEVAVAGFRLNPQTNAPARHNTYYSMNLKSVDSLEMTTIELPENPRIGFIKWSNDSQKLAFTLTQATGLELWILYITDGTIQRLTEPVLNAAYGTPYRWLDNDTLICKFFPHSGELPTESNVPGGPSIQENLGSKKPTRTYTNLLKNTRDEALFEYYLTSTLEKITLDGNCTQLISPCLINEAIPSPDSNLILISTIQKPFSYQVPAARFPRNIYVIDCNGKQIYQVADLPLDEERSIKFDAVRKGRRRISWRNDEKATLTWVEALDEGDPSIEVAHRDVLFALEAPFTAAPTQLWKSEYRFNTVVWGSSDVALVYEKWYDTRRYRTWRIYPNNPQTPPQLLCDRSFEDKYNAPGTPITKPGEYHSPVLRFAPDGQNIYLSGRGASADGVYPFLDSLNLETQQTERLWQCQDPYYEEIFAVLDDEAQNLITIRQSQAEPPNLMRFYRNESDKKILTNYQDPAPQLAGIHKELVQYHRADGVQLSANLYLPPGYDLERDGTLPTIFWVYPEEFKDKEFAGQITTPENTFSRPTRSSVLFLLTQGYAVLSGATLPIIGEGESEPNDTYIEQLIAGAQAAVDYVVERGISDRQHIGIGGHSYGAFTTANLLAHTELFCMGIARSGAYNRTLTPFGFQGEQRNFWEAQQTYIEMSPFTHASQIKTPLLLIHGANDSNAGTYPLQTKRLYEALKGNGAIVRWVELPLESHGYRSREAVGHVLWEMVNWCDKYLKVD